MSEITITEEVFERLTYGTKDGGPKRAYVTIFDQMYDGVGAKETVYDEVCQKKVDIDTHALRKFFMTNKNFEMKVSDIRVYTGRKYNEVCKILTGFDNINKYQSYDVFFFVFLSYLADGKGDERIMCTKDINGPDKIAVEDITNIVKTKKALLMKPKIFLIQADDRNYIPSDTATKATPMDVPPVPRKIPQDADMLVIVSSIPQCVTKLSDAVAKDFERMSVSDNKSVVSQPTDDRDPTRNCSFLIQAFIKEMEDDMHSGNDFLTRTVWINEKVDAMIRKLQDDGQYKKELPLPLITATLTKLLYFG